LLPALQATDAISAFKDHWFNVVAAVQATQLDQFHPLLPFLFIVPVPAIVHLTNTLYPFGFNTHGLVIVRLL